jgi:hypothetical protein
MPKGTKVHRCVENLKGKKGVNAYAACQESTGQSYATGKRLRKKRTMPKPDKHGFY